jgi:hypothetical protein
VQSAITEGHYDVKTVCFVGGSSEKIVGYNLIDLNESFLIFVALSKTVLVWFLYWMSQAVLQNMRCKTNYLLENF